MTSDCRQCGHPLDILSRPLKRLRWTRYWWRGLASLLTKPLRVCTKCGSVHTYDGTLLAAGAAETGAELRLRGFKEDMAYLRDGFASLVLVGEVGAIWTLMSSGGYDPRLTVVLGAIGGLALVPCTYFARKASRAKRELKGLKRARIKGTSSA